MSIIGSDVNYSMGIELDVAISRALLISKRIQAYPDKTSIGLIENYRATLEFEGNLTKFGIDDKAWNYVIEAKVTPKFIFAHPKLLHAQPSTSLYYRGISTLSLKRVQQLATSVEKWESGFQTYVPQMSRCEQVAKLYNQVISAIVVNSESWSMDDCRRNLLATIGVSLDGTLRNVIGKEGERAIKERLMDWLTKHESISVRQDKNVAFIGDTESIRMVFANEPDIRFEQLDENSAWRTVCTIEIKSGTDPAGALERLGAIQKSFAETPARCRNIAVLGVVTPEMRRRLDKLNVARDFNLFEILKNPSDWEEFLKEIFMYTLRVSEYELKASIRSIESPHIEK